ncbi:hypothetical protein AMECASPLE_014412 [Ameca splendens]|uniref:Uncharacterized protein n=1 Tax=Ameca splendens TaxID=208324 RepID=A0ABV0YZK9_9TELE
MIDVQREECEAGGGKQRDTHQSFTTSRLIQDQFTAGLSVVDADGCGQEGSPVVICPTADLKKPLNEDMYDSLMKRMFMDFHDVFHFMNNNSLHNHLQKF